LGSLNMNGGNNSLRVINKTLMYRVKAIHRCSFGWNARGSIECTHVV